MAKSLEKPVKVLTKNTREILGDIPGKISGETARRVNGEITRISTGIPEGIPQVVSVKTSLVPE